MAHLLKYDSTYGRFGGTVELNDDGLTIDGKKVRSSRRLTRPRFRGAVWD